MSDSCNELNIKPIKVNELGNYTSLQSDDLLLTIQKNKSTFYSRKTTFGDFVNSILYLTSSLSGNVNGNFYGNLTGSLFGNLTGSIFGQSLKGTLIGKSSITGIPFDTLNGQSISFKGTGSYSISSSYSPVSNYSTNVFSSSYSFSSSYVSCSIANNSLNSSYATSSSLSLLSITSSYSYSSERSLTSSKSDYTLNGLKANNTSYTIQSKTSLNGLYALSSSCFKNSSFVRKSITSSYTPLSQGTNLTKAFYQFVGRVGDIFEPLDQDEYSFMSFPPIAGYNIKSIQYVGRKRMWYNSEDKPDGSSPDKRGRWWPTFHVRFINPLKNTNYIVQGTIWELDWFTTQGNNGESRGNDNEIGTFQIPPSGSNKYTTGFTMSWQGGLKCDSEFWVATVQVLGTDISNINYNNVSAISGAINFV